MRHLRWFHGAAIVAGGLILSVAEKAVDASNLPPRRASRPQSTLALHEAAPEVREALPEPRRSDPDAISMVVRGSQKALPPAAPSEGTVPASRDGRVEEEVAELASLAHLRPSQGESVRGILVRLANRRAVLLSGLPPGRLQDPVVRSLQGLSQEADQELAGIIDADQRDALARWAARYLATDQERRAE